MNKHPHYNKLTFEQKVAWDRLQNFSALQDNLIKDKKRRPRLQLKVQEAVVHEIHTFMDSAEGPELTLDDMVEICRRRPGDLYEHKLYCPPSMRICELNPYNTPKLEAKRQLLENGYFNVNPDDSEDFR